MLNLPNLFFISTKILTTFFRVTLLRFILLVTELVKKWALIQNFRGSDNLKDLSKTKQFNVRTFKINPISPSILQGALPCSSSQISCSETGPAPLSSRIDHCRALGIPISKQAHSDLELLAIWQLLVLALLKNLGVFFGLILKNSSTQQWFLK